jgi:hypothetical protein
MESRLKMRVSVSPTVQQSHYIDACGWQWQTERILSRPILFQLQRKKNDKINVYNEGRRR